MGSLTSLALACALFCNVAAAPEPRAMGSLTGLALAGILVCAALPEPLAEPPRAGHDDDEYCIVCLETLRTHTLIPCGHRCLCEGCAASHQWEACPVCREPAQGVFRIYC